MVILKIIDVEKNVLQSPNFEWHKKQTLGLWNGFIVFSSSFPEVWNLHGNFKKKSTSPLHKNVGHQELLYTSCEK